MDVLAITDHNASSHVGTALRLAPEFHVRIVPGIEVSSREEVHVLALFPGAEALADFQDLVDAALPAEANVPEIFGNQVVFDERDEVVDLDTRLRQVGTRLGLERLVVEIKQRGGVAVPAHVFRPRFSLMSQLGFIDPGGSFDAVEIARPQWIREHFRIGQRVAGFPALSGSDAHFLEDIGRFALDLPAEPGVLAPLVNALGIGGQA
jgi:hypothetical protein